jgi:hypothetical protein
VYEGSEGVPIESFTRRSSGIRGGTALRSPGAICFDEALRRWDLLPSSISLLSVQVLLLKGVFYESTARHWDFWQCAVAASASCEYLVKKRSLGWSTTNGEMLKRAYWTCVLDEGYYHHDLDGPQTGLLELQDDVPLPIFNRDIDQPTTTFAETAESAKAYLHFLALISLKRLVDRIHEVVHKSMFLGLKLRLPTNMFLLGIPADRMSNPTTQYLPRRLLLELNFQLQNWRLSLPSELQWLDDRRNEFDGPAGSSSCTPGSGSNIMMAQLRARFYNARFTLLSPFLYLALHTPGLLAGDDVQHCASALDATLMWPLATASVSERKRLIPHHFTWTQNAMSFLCIFVMIGKNTTLKRICERNLDLRELRMSVAVHLCWLQDLKAIDGIAEWAWQLLHPLFIREMTESSTGQGDK